MALGLSAAVLVASLAAAPPAGETFAIEKVKAGFGPDAREGVTVLLIDGRIAAIGTDVAIPPGAERIDGTGLTLLPGFIDGFADVAPSAPREERPAGGREERPSFGGPRPAAPSGPAVSLPGNEGLAQDYGVAAYAETAEASRRGLKPEVCARELLGAPDKDADERLRNAGFVASLVAPTDGFIAGQACLVELSSLPPRSSVVTEPGLLVVKFRSGGGEGRGRRDGDFGYPSTLMGALAHLRQSFLDAQRLRSWRDSYRRSPATVSRPPSDSCLDTLLRALDGELRVAFLVDRETDIQRAMRFAEEFRLRALIVGGKEAWKCGKELAAARIPVIASLNFPDAPERKGATVKKPEAKENKEGSREGGKEGKEGAKPEGETAKPDAATTPREGEAKPEEPKVADAPDAPDAPARQEDAPVPTKSEEVGKPAEETKPAEGAKPDEGPKPDAAKKPEVAGPAAATDPTGTWEIPDPVLAEPLELFEQRKQEWEEEVRNVERLLAAGVQVALTTRGSNGTNDFFADLRVAIEKGLDANAAMTALTATPAALLGVEQELGALRVGAAGDLQLVEGELTSKERAVRHSFVAGRHFVGPKKDEAKKEGEARGGGRGRGRRGDREPGEEPPAEKALDLSGTWTLTSSRGEGFKSTLTLKQDGTKLTGKLESEMGSADISSGELDGDQFTITVTAQFQNRSFEFTLKGTATKDSLEGSFDTPFGEPSQFTAKRGPGVGEEEGGHLHEAMADGCGCGAHPEVDR